MPHSTTTTWTGKAGNDDFNVAQNWSAGVPTATTNGLINGTAASPLTIAFTAGTDAAKTLTATFTTLDLSGGSLSIAGASTLDALDQTGGLLDFGNSAGASSSFTGVVTQTAGVLEVDAGSLDLTSGGALGGTVDGGGTVVNAGTLAVDGLTAGGAAVLENQGTVTLAGGTLNLGDTAQSTAALQNDAAGTFDLTGDGGIAGDGTLVSVANAGLLEKSGGTGVSSISAPFNGAGEVLANSGTLAFLDTNTYAGTIDGVGTVAFDAPAFDNTLGAGAVDAPDNTLGAGAVLTVAAVVLGGTLDLGADVAYGGVLLTFGNALALGTSTLTLSNAADNLHNASILGSGTLVNDDPLATDGVTVGGQAVFANEGTATLAGGTLALGDGAGSTATLQNDAGAVFDITGDGSVTGGSIDGRPGVSIVNTGIFEKSGGTGTSDIDAPFGGSGAVFANSGVLAFLSSNSYAGTIIGTGAVGLDGTTNTLTAGLLLSVATIEAGGTLVFQSNLAFAGVLLANAHDLELGAHTLTLSNKGDDLENAQVGGTGTLKNATALTVDGMVIGGSVVFDNTRTATLGSTSLQVGDSATSDAGLTNEAGAVFDMTGNADILAGPSNNSPNASISNAGLFEKTGGVGNTIGVAFDSTGTVLVDSGAVAFQIGGIYGGTIAGSGFVVLDGPSNTLAAGVVLTIATLLAGGRLTFESDLSYSGELLVPGQTLVLNGHTLTLDNGLDQIAGASLPGGGTLVNSDSLLLDQVTLGGAVALVNAGTATLIGAALTLGDAAASTASLTNDAGGTLEMLTSGSIEGGAAFGHPDVSVGNDGLVEAAGGQFDVFAPFTNAGTVLVLGAGLTLHAANDLSAGTLGGGTWDTTGTIAFAAGGAVATDATMITLDGSGSGLLSTPAGAGPLALEATLTSIAAGGVLALVNGRDFAGQRTISSAGTIVLLDGTLSASGLTIEAGGTLGGSGTVGSAVAGAGLVEAVGGELVLSGGSAGALIGADATLELAVPYSGSVSFANGGTATMALDAPSDFTGTIDGLANGDTLDFRNTSVSQVQFSGSTLLVTIGAATTTYDLGAAVTGSGLLVQGDASGTGNDVVVSSAAFAPAVARINTPSPIDFHNLHVRAAGQTTLSVTNAATAPAEGLDATITPNGAVTARGSIELLAAGQTDAADLIVGLTASAPGVASGSVDAGFFSDGSGTSGNGKSALPSQTLALTGTFYALASAAFAAPLIVHAGGSGSFDLAAENIATPAGFAEGLRASVVGASGSIGASGTTGLVAAGSTDTSSLSLVLPTAAGIVSGTVTVDVQSDGAGTSGLGLTDLGDQAFPITVTVDNLAVATIERTGGASNLVASGNTVTLDFGTLAVGSGALTADLDVLNSAAGPADVLAGSFAGGSGTGFTNNGFAAFAGVTAGAVGGVSSVVFTPGTAGAYNETITLAPTGSNASGFVGALADETLVVLGDVGGAAALAQPRLDTANPFDFGAVRVGATLSEPLTISNIATMGAQALDVTAAASGAAIVVGTINDLAGGTTIFNGMTASLATGTGGVAQGSITFAFSSDNGSGTITPLTGQNITLAVAGTIYAEASFGATTPAPVLLHVGDPGTGFVTVHNTAPAPFAENLDVSIASTSGLGASVAGLGPIVPQSSADVAYTIDTANAGVINGKLGLDFASDGTGIDKAGPTPIGTQTITVAATVNNYATATLEASKGTLTQNGGAYTLDLGTVAVGAGPQTADLIVLNSAIGPADFLSGTLTAGADNGFIESNAGAFSNLQAGGSVDLEQLTLDPTGTGVFTATFALQATGANVSGFSAPLPGATVTVQETVGTGPAIFATVLGMGGSTVTIPFTTVANAAAAQIALNRISNAVLAATFTQLDYDGTGLPPAATPQIGLVELNSSTVPLTPLALGNNSVSAVLNGAAPQAVATGLLGNETVVSGSAGGTIVNLGTNTEVFFGGGGNQMFAEANYGPVGFTPPSADVWLDGNATFDDSGGNTRIHISTVPGGADATATTLTVIDNGAGTTAIDIGSDTTGTAESDAITFNGGGAATTVNAAGSAGLGGAVGGVKLLAFVGTGSGFINGNGSNVVLFGGSTGAVTLLGGAGTDIDAGAGGLIEAGTGGGSSPFASTVAASTTLVGGGDGDRLSGVGKNTVMIAGAGNESLYGFAPSTFEGPAGAQAPDVATSGAQTPGAQTAGAQAPGALTAFQGGTGGNTFLPGAGQTSIASVTDSNGGNLFQERVSGSTNTATISGFVSGMDSISGVNPAGGEYALVTNRTPGAQEMSLTVNGSTSTLTFGDGTTWTFNGAVQVSDFVNVASRGGV